MPSLSAMAARWFPASERSTVAAIMTSGNQLSASLGVIIATTLCSVDLLGGWPLIFYLAGELANKKKGKARVAHNGSALIAKF